MTNNKPNNKPKSKTKGAKPAPKKEPLPATLEARYQLVCSKIEAAARKAGRKPGDIILCAVTKYAEPEQVRELLQLGHRDFGENRVQVLVQHAAIVDEYMARQRLLPSARKSPFESDAGLFAVTAPQLRPVHSSQASKNAARTPTPHASSFSRSESAVGVGGIGANSASDGANSANAVRWHMIGHLQRNKAKKVTDFVRLIHSVDSLRLAEELQTIAVKKDQIIECLLQVNCSGEESKFGCPIPAAIPLAEQIAEMVNIRLRGLMTMAPEVDNPENARPCFSRCRDLFEEMAKLKLTEGPFNILSMGMSNDYEVAISEGANIVRVGTAIFGFNPNAARFDEVEEPEEEGA